MSSLSNKNARTSQIMRNVESGHYLREAINNLDGKFTTKKGKVRRLRVAMTEQEKREVEAKQEWDNFFRG